jgi:uncharacterized protein
MVAWDTLEVGAILTYKDAMRRCPTCRGEVKPREENPSFPFCTPRCRAVDLGRWFIGEYRMPGERPEQGQAEDRGDGDPEKH